MALNDNEIVTILFWRASVGVISPLIKIHSLLHYLRHVIPFAYHKMWINFISSRRTRDRRCKWAQTNCAIRRAQRKRNFYSDITSKEGRANEMWHVETWNSLVGNIKYAWNNTLASAFSVFVHSAHAWKFNEKVYAAVFTGHLACLCIDTCLFLKTLMQLTNTPTHSCSILGNN